jgi:hypothetical protein
MTHRLLTGRLLLGSLLLAAPRPVLDRLSDRPVGVGERRAARLLGARHLVEGAIVARHPGRRWLLAAAAVDATHALSMIAIAAIRPEHRRLATASALAATATATGGLLAAQNAPRRDATREH